MTGTFDEGHAKEIAVLTLRDAPFVLRVGRAGLGASSHPGKLFLEVRNRGSFETEFIFDPGCDYGIETRGKVVARFGLVRTHTEVPGASSIDLRQPEGVLWFSLNK